MIVNFIKRFLPTNINTIVVLIFIIPMVIIFLSNINRGMDKVAEYFGIETTKVLRDKINEKQNEVDQLKQTNDKLIQQIKFMSDEKETIVDSCQELIDNNQGAVTIIDQVNKQTKKKKEKLTNSTTYNVSSKELAVIEMDAMEEKYRLLFLEKKDA